MELVQEIIAFQDLTGTFSIFDVIVSLLLSFILTSVVAFVYQKTPNIGPDGDVDWAGDAHCWL